MTHTDMTEPKMGRYTILLFVIFFILGFLFRSCVCLFIHEESEVPSEVPSDNLPPVIEELPEVEDPVIEEVEEIEESEIEAAAAPTRAADPKKAVISLSTLEENFPDGATITLQKLKDVGLVLDVAEKLHICASGEISKSFTVEADRFTMDALIELDRAGGAAVMTYRQGGLR